MRLCLMFFSMTGYFLYITQKYQVRMEFAPALFGAWTSGMLFAGGILNFLPAAAGLIFAGGFVLLGAALKHRMWFQKRDILLYAGFLFVLMYFAWLLRGTHYTSYDNFSHWATVVKDMLLENRMPAFADLIIRFQSYPLGSSLFIYYICRILGTADAWFLLDGPAGNAAACGLFGTVDACFLWAQAFLLVSFLFSMTVFISRKNWYWMLPAGLFGIWALTVNNSIYELRVDTLLPLAAVSAYAVIYYYKDDLRMAAGCASGLFVLLVNIKNSGVFFYIACLLFLSAYAWNAIKKDRMYFIFTCLVPPPAAMFLWKRHVALVFPGGMGSKHSMSLENFEQVFAKKTTDDIMQIAGKMAGRFRLLGSVEVGMMLFLTIILAAFLLMRRISRLAVEKPSGISRLAVEKPSGISCRAVGKPSGISCRAVEKPSGISRLAVEKPSGISRAVEKRFDISRRLVEKPPVMLAAVWGCFILYTLSVFGMYMFSMPLAEALNLASYERYMLSVLIFLYGITIIYMMGNDGAESQSFIKKDGFAIDRIPLRTGSGRDGIHISPAAAVILLLAAVPVWQGRGRLAALYQKPDYAGTKRCSMQEMMKRDELATGKSCFIYCNGTDDDARYLFYLARYEFWQPDIAVVTKNDFAQNRERIPDYDYFIVWDSDECTDQYLEEHSLQKYQGRKRTGIKMKFIHL